MVATDGDRRANDSAPDQPIERESRFSALAVAESADPRRQPLEVDAPLRVIDPAAKRIVPWKQLEHRRVGAAMSAGSPDSATHRNGPEPRQKSGLTNAGTNPGMRNASRTPRCSAT